MLTRQSDGGAVESRLEAALAQASLPPPDRRLVMELVYGVVRWQGALDALIQRQAASHAPDWKLRNLLRLGLYQMFWLERVPDHAAVNETVSLARRLGCPAGTGFLNAVLRACARQKDHLRAWLLELRQSDPARGWSHPQWLVNRWRNRWGLGATLGLLEWNNTPAPLYARVNTLRFTVPDLLARWQREGVHYEPFAADWLPPGLVYRLTEHPPLTSLPSFQIGGFYLQDPSTLLAPSLLDSKPGHHVLDACAAPGGKTTFLAQIMENQGKITAWDSSPPRLKRLVENIQRLGADCIQATAADWAASPEPVFDRILLDVPCSNTGVMRRRVELRWRLQAGEITRLAGKQLSLLEQAARWLKPDGLLVYSTCSLETEENEEVVAAFLSQHRDWECRQQRTLRPFSNGVDGAYVAVLARPRCS